MHFSFGEVESKIRGRVSLVAFSGSFDVSFAPFRDEIDILFV